MQNRIFIRCCFILISFYAYAGTAVPADGSSLIFSSKDIAINSTFTVEYTQRSLSPIDYVTDTFILYSTLYLTLAATLPLQYPQLSLIDGETQFADRLLLEPFANDRHENMLSLLRYSDGSIIRDKNGFAVTAPNGRFYIKNLIEPGSFYLMGLYLRAKNYHPALYVGVLFTMSVLYQFTVIPLFTETSFEQFLKNPAVGAVFALMADEVSTYLLTMPYTAAHVFAYILNPFKVIPGARVRPLLFFEPYRKAVSLEFIIGHE